MKNLLKAILQVRLATKGVAKNGTNTFHHYNYATANDVIQVVREEMNKAGLITWPSAVQDITYHKDGSVEESTMIFKVAHVESGEVMEVAIRAAGEDKGDKKAYKTNTGGLKYLLIQLFLLPTDDDPENEGQEPKKKQQAAPGSNGSQGSEGGGSSKANAVNKTWLNKNTEAWDKVVKAIEGGYTIDQIEIKYKINKADRQELVDLISKAGKNKAA